MKVNIDTLERMIRHFKDDSEDLSDIRRILDTFEAYHQAIYQLEITRRLFANGAMDGEDYREKFGSQDATRTRNHNALLVGVNILNRMAREAGLAPFYDGEVSQEQPIRRQVADAILEFVNQVMLERI